MIIVFEMHVIGYTKHSVFARGNKSNKNLVKTKQKIVSFFTGTAKQVNV